MPAEPHLPDATPPRRDDHSIEVVLVDADGRAIGTAPKLDAHRRGLLHRAVSVFVFNTRGELLLQRRAPGKYHSGGLWTNTACSHPFPGEPGDAAARRCLLEEMGLRCDLRPAFTFTYREEVGEGLVEHERDEVFVGMCDDPPVPAATEVEGWRFASIAEIEKELEREPGRFTKWFPIALRQLQLQRPR